MKSLSLAARGCVAVAALLLFIPAAISDLGHRIDLPETQDGPGFADTKGRTTVPCRAPQGRQIVLLTAGQSNAANYLGAESLLYRPSAAVVNFNVYDGRCYAAKEPLLGAGGIHGNFADRLSDLIVKNNFADRVIVAPVALGGTIAQDWSSVLFPRIAAAISGLRRQGLKPDMILWQQGESEAQTPGYSAERYQSDIHSIVEKIRTLDVDAPFYVAMSTTCRDQTKPNAATIQEAQRSISDAALSIRTGPDTDQFAADFRADGCHFNAHGADMVALEWFKALWPEQVPRKFVAQHSPR